MVEPAVPVQLLPGDIFLTRGPGFISGLIRFFSRHIGESRAQVNHTGVIVVGGPLTTAIAVEAVAHVVRRPLWVAYGPPKKDAVAIFRPLNLTPEETAAIVSAAEGYVGERYGYLKIAAHLADWLLFGAYVFRRLAQMDNYPICSWLVAHAYLKAGKDFGVPAGAAEPDDIWDFVTKHPDKYAQIWPLSPLRAEA